MAATVMTLSRGIQNLMLESTSAARRKSNLNCFLCSHPCRMLPGDRDRKATHIQCNCKCISLKSCDKVLKKLINEMKEELNLKSMKWVSDEMWDNGKQSGVYAPHWKIISAEWEGDEDRLHGKHKTFSFQQCTDITTVLKMRLQEILAVEINCWKDYFAR
jgi:hypothetical protein